MAPAGNNKKKAHMTHNNQNTVTVDIRHAIVAATSSETGRITHSELAERLREAGTLCDGPTIRELLIGINTDETDLLIAEDRNRYRRKIQPGEGYRLLEFGEVIKAGDEFNFTDADWRLVDSVGAPVPKDRFLRYRRKAALVASCSR